MEYNANKYHYIKKKTYKHSKNNICDIIVLRKNKPF